MLFSVLALIASAVLLGFLAGPVLDRLRRPAVGPGTAIACWVAALAGTFIANTAVLVVALISPPGPGHGLLEWLRDCLPHHGYLAVIMAAAATLVLMTACCSRLARSLPRLGRAVRHRRRHREMLRLVAREHSRHADVLVLDHPVPVAYSLPARQRSIVVSTGAQESLTEAELGAVLAHERAHLRQRHHALLLMLDLVHALLPWLPTVRRAKSRLPILLEMAADDAAASAYGRRTLVDALCRLSAAPGVAGALGAAGESGPAALVERVLRLEGSGPVKASRSARVAACAFAAAAIAAPLLVGAVAIAELSTTC
ncbi:M56 family metallopeptidase [Actinomadura opuntiae]|uniref:M56 family metallopeptidase n=1 Tax=Actinomadura sp. OS1-43 TaxID=604315 RepID=UPI00255B0859|nr:M56 family metallopeptidase [Actinomadura sp. OS1-43]MDL4815049.1 M56 family metallopeptidase [Actinomadura sp. OS1-43]